MSKEFSLSTPNEGFVPITNQIQDHIDSLPITEGLAIIFCPHTTAGITINENADPDVVHDLLLALDSTFSDDRRFLHREGNSAAHLKASVMGSSVTVPIVQGKLALGMWQGIFFCEFDGPRRRTFVCKIMQG
jgi:secondary thiamine-phosphate synthase enzyme